MRTLAFFNHKGGVGKTTLAVNVAAAMSKLGLRVMLVDADPQCNLTSFYLSEKDLDRLLGESGDAEGGTIWSAIKPVVDGKGPIKDIRVFRVGDGQFLVPGDVLLADYEEELPAAWTGSFARKERDYDVMCALSRAVRGLAKKFSADVMIYDVGPNVGPLNRTVLLDADYFTTPVAADLFSLRALSTVGHSLDRWITDWRTIRSIASSAHQKDLLHGMPVFLGYITSAYKVSSGRAATAPHDYWEAKIAPRVQRSVVDVLEGIDEKLVPFAGDNKIAAIKNFQSLAPQAQSEGVPIGELRGLVNPGYNRQVAEAQTEFAQLAREIVRRMRINAASVAA